MELVSSAGAAATAGFADGGGATAAGSDSELHAPNNSKQLARPVIGALSSSCRGKRFILIMPLL
jgi:hypothetical protein